MTQLPPEYEQFASFLDAQPGPVQIAFQYCLALSMVEYGQADLIKTEPSENGAMVTFKTTAGDVFTVIKPQITEEQEVAIIEQLRDILDGDSPND
jgi:hypothetical protein